MAGKKELNEGKKKKKPFDAKKFSKNISKGVSDGVSKILDKDEISKSLPNLLRNLFIVLIILAIIGLVIFLFQKSFDSPQDAADKISSFGALGPIIIIVLIALEVVIAPIPGYVIAIASGYAFGIIGGTIYSYLGNILGNVIAFFLSRRFGRPLVEKLVKKKNLEVYDRFFKENGKAVLWLVYLLPVFPSDIITFVSGLSKIKWKDFMLIICIAFIPNMLILNYFGATLYSSGFGWSSIVLGSILLVIFISISLYFMHLKGSVNKKK